jgi:hypothetical protein
MMPTEICDHIRYNGPNEISKHVTLIKKFIRNDDLTIHDIPLDLNEELLSLDANQELFIYTPLIMYIIKTITNEFITKKTSGI